MSYEYIVVESTSEAKIVEETSVTTTTAQITESHLYVTFYIIVMKCCLSLAIFLVNSEPLYILKCYVKQINVIHLTVAYLVLADICLGLQPWFRLFSIFIEHQNWWKGVCVFEA